MLKLRSEPLEITSIVNNTNRVLSVVLSLIIVVRIIVLTLADFYDVSNLLVPRDKIYLKTNKGTVPPALVHDSNIKLLKQIHININFIYV